jgi:hypothetical protein
MRRIVLALLILLQATLCHAQGLMTLGAGSVAAVSSGVGAADLQFANGVYTGCTQTNCLTNSNSTGGYCTDSTGVLHLIAANTLRICSGTGLLVESNATNLIEYSQGNFSNAYWTKYNSTVSDNSTTAPDGTTTATSLIDAASSNQYAVYNSYSGNFTSAISIYMKAAAQPYGYIQINTGGGQGFVAFNLSGAGSVGSVILVTGSQPIALGVIQALANGWYRCTAIVFGALAAVYGPTNSLTTRTYTGTGAAAMYIWGAQAESIVSNQNNSSSYIPTTSSTATRSADNISASGVLASTLAGSTGTVVANTNNSFQSLAATIIDANGTVLLGKTSGNVGTTAVGATLSTGNTGTWTGANDLGLAWNASGGAIQLNGGAIATDTTARTPTATFHLGSTSGSSAFFNGYITRLTAYATKQASPQ